MKLIYVILFLISLNVSAVVDNNLSSFLQKHITENSMSFERNDSSVNLNLSNNESDDIFFLNTFILRIRGNLSFKIQGLAGLSVIPETEIVWQRVNPNGYETFKK